MRSAIPFAIILICFSLALAGKGPTKRNFLLKFYHGGQTDDVTVVKSPQKNAARGLGKIGYKVELKCQLVPGKENPTSFKRFAFRQSCEARRIGIQQDLDDYGRLLYNNGRLTVWSQNGPSM
jgi:hypothetical protein